MPLDPKSNRAKQFAIWGAALIAVVLAVYTVRSLTRVRVDVVVAHATYRDIIKTSSTTGKVEPTVDFQAHAQAAGQVQQIDVKVGDTVEAGQLLLKMDDADALARLASANSALRAAELATSDIEHGGTQDERNTNASDQVRANLQRQQDAASLAALQQLQQKGAASPAEIASARARLQADDDTLHSIEQHSTQRYDKADRARAQAELDDARAAVAAGQSTYDSDNIRSKISGTVYYLPVSQYDYVNTGDSLVSVANLNHMRISAYFDEPEIGDLAEGEPVTITWDAKPGMVWTGHITQVPTTIITYNVTRYVGECTISIDDAKGTLQPNANVIVTVTTSQHLHVLSVPREAVRTDGTGNFVFRIVDGKLVRTPVQIGSYNLVREEILSGLSEGDTVALNATTPRDLSDGLEVTTVQSKSDPPNR